MKVAFVHFRVGLTDGVSFEIDKRKALVESLGHKVLLIAGSHAGPIDLHIPAFEYKSDPDVAEVDRLAFIPDAGTQLRAKVAEMAGTMRTNLEAFYAKHRFGVLFLHNLFCLPVCLPGSLVFKEFLEAHPEVKCIATHHDFYWEPPREQRFAFTNPYAQELLRQCFPPDLPNLRHVTINSLAQKDLREKNGIEAEIVTDTFDFSQPGWTRESHPSAFREDVKISAGDIVFMTGVRVRKRKAVELAIDTVAEVTRRKAELVGKTKYDGTPIPPDSRVVFLIPGEYTSKEKPYVDALKRRAKEQGVEVRWIADLVGSEDQKAKGERKYNLWDCYVWSDYVLYTSHWEGWGNQFIEAVFARKPIAVFEYPVFVSDIATQGFRVASLGSCYQTGSDGLIMVPQEKVAAAATEILATLTNPDRYREQTDTNFAIGAKHYDTNTQLKAHVLSVFALK
ncbi:MAG: glycosyltransferase [Patescibacteria group bacterium]|nr:glycosyltransferase [Patescibacteria group bacterium]